MCGIAGFTHKRRPANGYAIRKATQSLLHRGPDQQDIYESQSVSLGAVRLKIIDLESGDQPFLSEDRDTVVVFNGEIYNSAELRGELERRGHRFRSRSDTEVVLRSFLEWDRGCLPAFRGMFALALWKESEKRLVLARDRMGIKPLYIYWRGDEIHFASELKALFAHPEVERRIDPEALQRYLSFNYVPGPDTLVEGIKKLPPGQWLERRDGRTESGVYWRLHLRPNRSWTLASAKEALDARLKDSIREHLISDVPLGVWLSGGLDSSTIVHYAAAEVPRLKTFSISFRGRQFDESRYFRRVASVYGTDHHEFDLNPDEDLAGAIEELPYYWDEPGADAGALPVWFLSRLSRNHVTVALSGEGADELFGGYLTYLADNWSRPLRLFPASMRRLALRVLRRWPVSDEKIALEYKLKRFLEGSLLPPDEAHMFWNGTFTQAQRMSLCGTDSDGCADAVFPTPPLATDRIGGINRYLWLDQLCYLPDDILAKCDRMSMAHSLEVRPPFLDHRIVELAASFPQNLKVSGWTLKRVLRELMKDKLPNEVLDRKKEGFDIPAHEWLRGPLRPLLLDTLSEAALARHSIFRPKAIQEHVRAHLERRANLGYHLWGLLSLFLWIERWGIQTAAREERQEEVPRALPAAG